MHSAYTVLITGEESECLKERYHLHLFVHPKWTITWNEMQILQSRNHLLTPQTQTTNIGWTNGSQCKTNFWKIAYFTERDNFSYLQVVLVVVTAVGVARQEWFRWIYYYHLPVTCILLSSSRVQWSTCLLLPFLCRGATVLITLTSKGCFSGLHHPLHSLSLSNRVHLLIIAILQHTPIAYPGKCTRRTFFRASCLRSGPRKLPRNTYIQGCMHLVLD